MPVFVVLCCVCVRVGMENELRTEQSMKSAGTNKCNNTKTIDEKHFHDWIIKVVQLIIGMIVII